MAEPPDDYAVTLKRLGELGCTLRDPVAAPGHDHRAELGHRGPLGGACHADRPLSDATVVQLIGAVGHGDPLVDGAELGRWLAQKLHASFRFLSAPLLVEDEAVARALRHERTIEETLALAAQADIAIIGIGTPEPEQSSLLRAGYLTRAELQALLDQGVVGDVVAHQLDAEGRRLDIPANRKAISLDAESLRRIPKVVAVSGGDGQDRGDPRRAAGRGSARAWSRMRSRRAGCSRCTPSGASNVCRVKNTGRR